MDGRENSTVSVGYTADVNKTVLHVLAILIIWKYLSIVN